METINQAKSLADILAGSFETRERQSGGTFHALKDGSPDWIQEAVKDAHHDGYELRLCDDWIYQQCDSIASDIRQKILHDDIAPSELLENLQLTADDYTSNLLSWLSSHRDNLQYCNDYAEENGFSLKDNPYGDGRTGLEAIIAGGQMKAKREIASAMVGAFLNQLEASA
mgnify:CR=1 FL=1